MTAQPLLIKAIGKITVYGLVTTANSSPISVTLVTKYLRCKLLPIALTAVP
jgi:hypothetical protein